MFIVIANRGDVAIDEGGGTKRVDQWRDTLFERLTLIGEGEFRAVAC
jgi:hypothetical protein